MQKSQTSANWISMGAAVGAAMGVIMDNIGLWVGLGVAIASGLCCLFSWAQGISKCD
jgi:hypothetical protein